MLLVNIIYETDYTRALHNAASNSADLGIALMIKSSLKFLQNAVPWISVDKKKLNFAEILV